MVLNHPPFIFEMPTEILLALLLFLSMPEARATSDTKGSEFAFLVPAIIACVYFVAHMATATRYGYFRDALFYLACSEHQAWGDVDQPPLIVFIACVARH